MADTTPLTLADIIAALRAGEGRAPRLLPMPPSLIAWAFKAIGRAEMWERLAGELVADPSKLLRTGWKPVAETYTGLVEAAQAASPRKSTTASRSTR